MEIKSRFVETHIVRKNNKGIFEFLLLKRSPNVKYPNVWQMVTGKIEKGEKAYETALREVKEEIKLELQGLWAVPNINSFYLPKEDAIILIPVFVGFVDYHSKIELSHEHSEFKWVGTNEAQKLLAWPGQKQSVKLIEEYLTNTKLSELIKIEI